MSKFSKFILFTIIFVALILGIFGGGIKLLTIFSQYPPKTTYLFLTGIISGILILGTLICWLIVIRRYFHSKKTIANAQQQVFENLQHNVHLALKVTKHIRPRIVLLGEENSGKTSLLAHSGIPFYSVHDQLLTTVKNTTSFDWWHNKDVAVFVDPAGTYCSTSTDSGNAGSAWRNFLNIIYHKSSQPMFDGIWFVVDVVSLCSDSKSVHSLIENLKTLTYLNPSIPISIVITKIDLLQGFRDFFSDLSKEEHKHIFGFTLYNNKEQLPLIDLLRKRFTRLLQRINQRFIKRLYQEQNITRRIRIKDFPFQFEKLLESLSQLIEQLNFIKNNQLTGIYFTSSIQNGEVFNPFSMPLETIFHRQKALSSLSSFRSKSYFTENLFKTLTQYKYKMFPSPQQYKKRIRGMIIACMLIIFGFFAWHFNYLENIKVLNNLQQELISQNIVGSNLSLDDYSKLLAIRKKYPMTSYSKWIGLGQINQIFDQLQNSYDTLLERTFIPELQKILTLEIQNSIDPAEKYAALKIYLMFANPNYLNKQAVNHWFSNHWAKQFPQDFERQQNLILSLDKVLKQNKFNFHPDNSLIKSAQNTLKQQPLSSIVLNSLNDMYAKQKPKPISNAKRGVLDFENTLVPAVFDQNHFNTIFYKDIPQIATMLTQGDWVLNTHDLPSSGSIKNNLIKDAQTEYLKRYQEAHEMGLSQLTLKNSTSTEDLLFRISQLTTPSSDIWKELKLTLQQINTKENSFYSKSNNIKQIQLFLKDNNQKNKFKNLKNTLKPLIAYIHTIDSSNPKALQNAFNMATRRLTKQTMNDPISEAVTISQQFPQPIQNWIIILAQNSWQITLNKTHLYLNQLWSEKVVSFYNHNIRNKYPIFQSSKNDIDTQHFTQFFGPNGLIEDFFNRYLKLFVDTTQTYWTWKKINGAAISIPQNTLDMIIRSSLIQKMFYTDNLNAPTLKFSLTPISLSPNVSFFLLNLGGQRVEFYPGIKRMQKLIWPGPKGTNIMLKFNVLVPTRPRIILSGPWAWLRLVDSSALQTTNNPQEFEITFSANGYSAQYQLIADNPVNPYLPNLLHAFRCPDHL